MLTDERRAELYREAMRDPVNSDNGIVNVPRVLLAFAHAIEAAALKAAAEGAPEEAVVYVDHEDADGGLTRSWMSLKDWLLARAGKVGA